MIITVEGWLKNLGSKAMDNSVLLNTVDMGVANRLGIPCVCVYVARAR